MSVPLILFLAIVRAFCSSWKGFDDEPSSIKFVAVLSTYKVILAVSYPPLRVILSLPVNRLVIKNLVSNAINHSNTNKDIDVKIGQIKGFATISVIDYGQGIPKDEIKMIFNKYYSAAKKLRKVGTGLGLYLSQQITEAHGGEITVESEENVRTEFCVKLPM